MPHRGLGEAVGRESSGVALPIVVVDDDPGMRAAIERILQLGGYSTTIFPSAETCLSASHSPAACLVLDIRLPGISGFELYSRLVARDPAVPVVFITAHDDARTRAQAIEAGGTAFLAKPFAGRELLRVVDRSISNVRPGGEA